MTKVRRTSCCFPGRLPRSVPREAFDVSSGWVGCSSTTIRRRPEVAKPLELAGFWLSGLVCVVLAVLKLTMEAQWGSVANFAEPSAGTLKEPVARPTVFKWRQTEPAIILCAVRWYLRYLLSLRDVEELLEERGLAADHTTVWRWVQRYGPELLQRPRRHLLLANCAVRLPAPHGTVLQIPQILIRPIVSR